MQDLEGELEQVRVSGTHPVIMQDLEGELEQVRVCHLDQGVGGKCEPRGETAQQFGLQGWLRGAYRAVLWSGRRRGNSGQRGMGADS